MIRISMQSSLKLIGFKRSILLLNRLSKNWVNSRPFGNLSRHFSISNKRCFSTTSSDVPPVVTSSLYYREEILELLQLKTFTEEEWRQSFQSLQVDKADNTIELKESLTHLYQQKVPWLPLNNKKIEVLASEILPKKTHPSSLDNVPSFQNKRITFDQYKQYLTKYSERLDKRVWNIGMSFLLTGVSVGVIIPCMPLLVSQLQISPSSFGFVISAFGLSKLLGNVPSGFLVEKYGRTAVVTSGLVLCGLANCAISFIFLPGFGTPWLVFCRFLAGIGVSGFIAGGQMIMSDISTHLNRTRTIAPVMASFSAGTAFGPAIGGILVDTIGLTYTYATVGACFGLIALQNQLTMKETKRVKLLDQRPSSSNNTSTITSQTSSLSPSSPSETILKAKERPKMSSEILKSFKTASNAWKELLHIPQIKNMIILNTVFWFAMSGAQFTLLPLHLVSNTFNFTSFEIGSCFAYSSIVSFLASQPIAYLSDKYGKQKVMIAGMTLVSSSVLSLSFTSNLTELLVVLTPLAAGITSMNAATPALMTELTTSEQRAQGLSLLRTASDIGFLFGAVFSGYVASHFDLSTAFLTDGTTVLSAMIWFYLRNKLVSEASSSSPSSSLNDKYNDNDKKKFE